MAAPGVRGKYKTAQLTLAAAGTQVIEAAVVGQRITVVHFVVSNSAATALPSFESSAATVLAGPFNVAVDGSVGSNGSTDDPLFWTAVGEGLTFRTAGAGLAKGFITYLAETSL